MPKSVPKVVQPFVCIVYDRSTLCVLEIWKRQVKDIGDRVVKIGPLHFFSGVTEPILVSLKNINSLGQSIRLLTN